MNTIIKTTKGIFAASVLAVCLTGCSEDVMDQINKDNDHTNSVAAKFILADVITSTAFSNIGGDLSVYGGTYTEYEVGVENQTYNAEIRLNEPSAASTFNNHWNNVYTTLKNARIALSQCQESGRDEGNYVTRGIAGVMAAYNSAIITDAYGDAPYSQAALVDENGSPVYMTPKIDKQEEIYKSIMTQLDEAIADLQKSDISSIGKYDFLYEGDASKWLKFAYGLKARYTMRLINHSSNVKQDMESVLDFASKSFTSADEQAAYAVYDANNINPFYGVFASRKSLAISQSLVEKLGERNDPRLLRAVLTPESTDKKRSQVTGMTDPKMSLAPNGDPEQSMQKYGVSAFVYSSTAPTLLLSYHEVKFLEAEALCRLNRKSEAQVALKDAVVAGIANAENSVVSSIKKQAEKLEVKNEAITESAAKAYFDEEVLTLFTANALKETMLQKYIALWGASGETFETYNDIRRMKALGEDFIVLKNKNKFPVRLPYGNSDTTANPEVKAAYGDGQYVYSENVWWAGGTR